MSFMKSKSQFIGQDADTGEIISQSNLVIERCAKFASKRDSGSFKPNCGALKDTSCDQAEAKEAPELFVLIISFFTLILRFVLVISEEKTQRLIEITKGWMETFMNKLFYNEGTTTRNAKFLLPFPLVCVCIAYAILMTVLLVLKTLLLRMSFFKNIKF